MPAFSPSLLQSSPEQTSARSWLLLGNPGPPGAGSRWSGGGGSAPLWCWLPRTRAAGSCLAAPQSAWPRCVAVCWGSRGKLLWGSRGKLCSARLPARPPACLIAAHRTKCSARPSPSDPPPPPPLLLTPPPPPPGAARSSAAAARPHRHAAAGLHQQHGSAAGAPAAGGGHRAAAPVRAHGAPVAAGLTLAACRPAQPGGRTGAPSQPRPLRAEEPGSLS